MTAAPPGWPTRSPPSAAQPAGRRRPGGPSARRSPGTGRCRPERPGCRGRPAAGPRPLSCRRGRPVLMPTAHSCRRHPRAVQPLGEDRCVPGWQLASNRECGGPRHRLGQAPLVESGGAAGMSFRLSFHQPLLRPTGAHLPDDPPDLSCKDSTGQHTVDDPLLSCNLLPCQERPTTPRPSPRCPAAASG
jgi:hypothetical protein